MSLLAAVVTLQSGKQGISFFASFSTSARAALRAGDYAELALLETLERGLSDAYMLPPTEN